jgi:hypothetical protein
VIRQTVRGDGEGTTSGIRVSYETFSKSTKRVSTTSDRLLGLTHEQNPLGVQGGDSLTETNQRAIATLRDDQEIEQRPDDFSQDYLILKHNQPRAEHIKAPLGHFSLSMASQEIATMLSENQVFDMEAIPQASTPLVILTFGIAA